MKKLLLLPIVLLVLSGCDNPNAMTPQQAGAKMQECYENHLGWRDVDTSWRVEIACSVYDNLPQSDFEKCSITCEKLFNAQADTWGNGSESQSESAIECLELCLTHTQE